MIKNILLLTLVILTRFPMHAQSQASVNMSEGGYGMTKTNLQTYYDYSWGTVNGGMAVHASYEFFNNRIFTVTANGRLSTAHLSFDSADLSNGFNPDEINLNGSHLFGQTGLLATFRSRMWGKPIMTMAMMNAEWGAGGFARVSGIAMGLLMLRANRTTQFGIGPLVMINTSSKIPAFLVFMYRHSFNRYWHINLYGAMLGIEHTPSASNLFSIGADVDVKAFYFKPGHIDLPSKCRFTSTSLRPMVRYRRRLITNIYLDLKSGVAVKMSCRVNGVTGSREYFDCSRKVSPFIHTGLTCNL